MSPRLPYSESLSRPMSRTIALGSGLPNVNLVLRLLALLQSNRSSLDLTNTVAPPLARIGRSVGGESSAGDV
ncbi:hypothetical protein NLI96_g7503 [Meripilus lineatus]|uniref:Uncharacterized protein n=1 Tax=Meripilus lineatus TaxID=2056292 RepID=A0AAD5YH46_9APHY|nr:hypothetical protein NLI96_g7503 [Physisporinus lineatus]